MIQNPKDRKTWLNVEDSILNSVYRRQFNETNRSTIIFCDWLEQSGFLKPQTLQNIMDIGAGLGANANYMAKLYPKSQFTGLELNPDLVKIGNEILRDQNTPNAEIISGDLYNLNPKYRDVYDGVVSYMMLSWLPDFELPLIKMAALNPNWIAMTSLFYEGPVNTIIRTQDYTRPTGDKAYREHYYNIYSLPLVQECLAGLGYEVFKYTPFEIDIDLLQHNDKGMHSYTKRLENGKRIQFGGPVLLNWYFVAAARTATVLKE